EGATSGTRTNTHQLWKYKYLSGNGSGSGGSWVNRGGNLPSESGLSGNAVFDTQGGYDMLVKVKPNDENFLVIGGTNLYRTTDAFATTSHWTRIGGYSGPSTYALYTNHHPDQHAGAFKPGSNIIFVCGDDGGVQRTSDVTASTVTWNALDNSYYTTQFYAVALDHGTTGDNTIVGGMQDNGTWLTTSSNPATAWTNELSGDGTVCAIADGGSSIYVSSQNSLIYRLTSTNFTRVDPTGGTGYLFVNPFTLDPNNSAMMYLAGGTVLWRNSDLTGIALGSNSTTSTNWTSLSNTTVSGATITAVAVSKSPANKVYYGTDNGELFRLDGANTGNPSPTNIYTGKGFPSAYVNCIAVDRDRGDSAIVVFSNYSVKSLFFTADGGSNWTNISGNLEQNSDGSGNGPSCRWAVIVHGTSSIHYYVATSTGIYSTTTLNGTSTVWSQEGSTEIGNVVTDLLDARESDGTIIAGTHGNGVFSTTIADPLPVELSSLSASSRGSSAIIAWSTSTEVDCEGFDVERRPIDEFPLAIGVWTLVDHVDAAGTTGSPRTYSCVDRNLPPGMYAYRLKQIDRNGSSKYSGEVRVEVGLAPRTLTLQQNYPNPFNPTTTIGFTLPADGRVTLRIFDITGREVATILDETRSAGVYQQAVFDGSHLASGMYFAVLRAGGKQLIKKMLMMK
ncbi:MAG TPA: T9SS type A sorting domain-containing protein, partial [Bacteroidota bacterium]|nr:T9SS type A sorting domain-containing protein [Bacteroidota bacterium]